MDSTEKQESAPGQLPFISFPSRYRYQGATNDHISQSFLIYLFHKVSQFFFSFWSNGYWFKWFFYWSYYKLP